MICNGAAISRTTYADLYSVIGTLYGSGNGTTTFNLPNLQNRMPIGLGSGSFNALNNKGGAETISLSTSNMPAHQHYIGINTYAPSGIGVPVPMGDPNLYMHLGADTNGNTERYRMTGRNDIAANAGLTSSNGSGAAFNKMSPYIVINFIIYTGYNILITPINTVTVPNAGINDLVDVSITTPADGQLLKYNSSGLNWINSTIPIGGSYNGYFTGAFPTVNPPNSTSGNLFTVPIAGNYILTISASAFMNSGTIINIRIWINGADTGRELRLYANETYSHKTLVPISFRYALNAGNNYLYLRMLAGTSDGNDYASFSWVYSPVIV
jgi:microcystin-dependent protein